jgi:uncharacterized protein YjiK
MTCWLLLSCFIALDCSREHSEPAVVVDKPVAETSTVTSWLSRYDLREKNPAQFKLPKKLSEISGLAITEEGELLCHDDEQAVVYRLDLRTGKVLGQFSFGSGFLEDDFEGIAVRGDTIYIVNSSGDLFEFPGMPDKKRTSFRLYKTALSSKNDVEGLEYDPVTNCLLLACKGDPGKGFEGDKAVYSFSLATKVLEPSPRFLIDHKKVEKASKGAFNPSGIALHPVSGTFFVISADGHAVIEVDRSGRMLAQQEIPKSVNTQPEGITFAPDNAMILCNDGQGGTGTITRYEVER